MRMILAWATMKRNAALAQSAALAKAEQAGQPAALFVAYMRVAVNDCIDRYDKNAIAKAKANLPKLGRDLAKTAEARAPSTPANQYGPTDKRRPFSSIEAIGDHQDANRVLIKAVQAKPEDLRLFEAAWNIDNGRYGPADPPPDQDSPTVPHRLSGKNWPRWPRSMPID